MEQLYMSVDLVHVYAKIKFHQRDFHGTGMDCCALRNRTKHDIQYTFTDDDVCVVLENLFVQILILGKVQISYDIFVLNLFEEIFLFLRLITGLGIRI
jgi:hypothetical protein